MTRRQAAVVLVTAGFLVIAGTVIAFVEVVRTPNNRRSADAFMGYSFGAIIGLMVLVVAVGVIVARAVDAFEEKNE